MLAHVWRGGNKAHTDKIKQIGLQKVNALRISCLANLFAFFICTRWVVVRNKATW